MKKRILTMILAALLTASTVSCGSTEQIQETTADTTSAIETTEEAETQIQLGIPEEDNGGRDFHVFVPTEKAYEFVTENTGEAVNDATFDRSLKTEEHFNIKFTYQYEDGNWDFRDTYNSFISNAVIAGDSTYDLATGFIVCTLPLFTGGNFLDLATMKDLNLDNPWWIANQKEDLSIKDKLFCCLGDSNLSVYKDCAVVYFNKRVLNNFQLEDPYTLVREKKWVMEKFLEMSEAAVVDLNGDGKVEFGTDAVGNYLQGVPFRALQTGMDVTFIITDENDNRVVTPLTDRIVTAYELAEPFISRGDMYTEFNAVDFYTFTETLATDRSLFHMSYLYVLEGEMMRNMDADFGIVPYPKLDASQERFKTQIGTSSNANFLPITCSDPDLTCRVLETLAYHSMLNVVPTYYTVALENKYTRDEDVPEMLALIRDGMTMNFDFAFSTSQGMGGTNTAFGNANGNLASYLASQEPKWNTGIEKLIAGLE